MIFRYKKDSFAAWLYRQGDQTYKIGDLIRLTGMERKELQTLIRGLTEDGFIEAEGTTFARTYRVVRATKAQPTTEQPQRSRSRSRRRKTPRNAAQAPTQAPATTEALETAVTPPQVPMPPPPPPVAPTEPEETEEQKAEKDRKIKEMFEQFRRQFGNDKPAQPVRPPLPPEIGPKHPEAATRRPLLYPVDGGVR